MIIKGYTGKEYTMNILNGLAIGIVTVLLPGALLTVPMKALAPIWPPALLILQATWMYNAMMGIVVGFMVGHFFKFTPLQMASVGLATVFASGVGRMSENGKFWTLVGTGDIITMGFTAAIAVWFILLIGEKIKSYAILVLPTLTLLIAGSVGTLIFPYITHITRWIGEIIAACITLQPYLMCVLLSMIFATLIMSPFTTVGIALAISLSGLGSGAANLGICSAAFGFCIAGWKVNSIGVNLSHWIGSPKISMASVAANPKTILPIYCTAIIMGVLAAFFNIQGTPFSAGFGFSGFVGPVAALDLSSAGWTIPNTILIFAIFGAVPVGLGIFFNYIFVNVLHMVTPEDYKLKIK